MGLSMPPQKPDRLFAIGMMTLISGIINILWGMGLLLMIAVFGIGTFFVGCLCLPLAIYPLALGIVEVLYALKLMRNPISPTVKPAYYIAVMEIIDTLFGNIIALVVGVVSLLLYNDVAIRRFFGET